MNEQLVRQQPQKLSFSGYINSGTGQRLVANALPDRKQASAFTTAIIAAVAANPALAECTYESIVSAALQGTAMGLAPSPQLGQMYMVPFKNKKQGTTTATFVVGYRGLIQLAMRSGQYIDLDAMPIKEGEYLGRDPMTGRPRLQFIEDDDLREQLPVVGYMAYFELQNGAKKVLYWSKEKMINHADKYSMAFSKEATGGRYPKVSFADYQAGNYPKNDEWLYSSFWYKEFDTMACKTMLRQLISKWGPVSIEMQNAIATDEQNEVQGVDVFPQGIPVPEPVPVVESQAVPDPVPAVDEPETLNLSDV